MAIITLGSRYVIDETADLQFGTLGDADVDVSTLPLIFAAFLDALDNSYQAFAAANGIAASASNVIKISSATPVDKLVLADANNGTLDGDPAIDSGGSPVRTLDGNQIFLYATDNPHIVIGREGNGANADSNGEVVFAIYLQPNATNTEARLWTVLYEPIQHPTGNPDEVVDLGNSIKIGAPGELVLNLGTLASGQLRFGSFGEPENPDADDEIAVIVIARDLTAADGDKVDTVNTSQGGGSITIGVSNQMFDPGEGAYFTFVTGMNADAGDPTKLPSAGANQAGGDALIAYDALYGSTGASFTIVQIQGGGNTPVANVMISAFLETGAPQGAAFVAGLASDAVVKVLASSVRVTVDGVAVTGWTATQIGNTVNVTNVPVGATVRYQTVDPVTGLETAHNRALIENAVNDANAANGIHGNPFDIGGFALVGPPTFTAIGQLIGFGDDGPTVAPSGSEATLTVDETTFGADDTQSFAPAFSVGYGTDGPAQSEPLVYSLYTPGGDSGLIDTLTGDAVILSLNGAGAVEGRTEASDDLVFTVSVDADGMVTLDQARAVVHNDPLDHDEDTSPAQLSADNLIQLTATATDGDTDVDSETIDIGLNLNFEDDGPAIDLTGAATPTLTTDDTDIPDSAGPTSFAGLFTGLFRNDAFKDSDDNDIEDLDAIRYALGVSAAGGVFSGLTDTISGDKIYLYLESGQVVGRVGLDDGGGANPAGAIALTISVDANSGDVSLEQSRSVVHDDSNDAIESGASAAGLASAALVTLTATIEDGDGDTDSAVADIGDAFGFEDDGPSIAPGDAPPELTVDESDFLLNHTMSFVDAFSSNFGQDGPKDSDDNDVADVDATTYELDFNAGPTGLVDTLTNEAVVLALEGDDVVGLAGAGGPEVFRVSVDAAGNVTLDQSRAVVHDPENGPNQSTTLASNDLITLTATVTDGDGDHASQTIGIAQSLNFLDDAPDITRNLAVRPVLYTDDSLTPGDSDGPEDFSILFGTDFGADGFKDGDDDDVADDDAVTYALSLRDGPATISGLTDTLSDDPILLRVNGDGDVEGYVADGDLLVFKIALDNLTGEITQTQYRAIVHDDPLDHEETGAASETMAADLIVLTATITDGDGDTDEAATDIGDAFRFEDDGPTVTGANVPVVVDDDGGAGGNEGGDGDNPDAFRIVSGTVVPVFDFGADGQGSYTITLANLANPPALTSQGEDVEFVQTSNLLTAYVDTDLSSDYDATLDREVFTFALNGATGAFDFTLIDQIDHPTADTEDDLLINIGVVLQAIDGDGDKSSTALPVQLNIDFDDDSPVFQTQISDGFVDGNVKDNSVTNSLNGAVGFDENDGNDETGAGVKTYTFSNFTTPTNAWPNLVGVESSDGTSITYYDGVGGDAIYSIVLDQDGSGEYTFTVLKQTTSQKLEFDFSDLPSGQNLFGVLVDRSDAGVQDVDGVGLLVVGRDAVLNGSGSYTNVSDTINTSKGGGGVTIGVDNQMFDPGDGAVFVFLDNPDNKAIGGLSPGGLTQNTADDADTLGFVSTHSTTSAELEVVQKQGSAVCGMRITAYDVDVPGTDNTIVSAANPLGADVNQEGRDFINDPLAGGTIVSIDSVQVFDRANPSVLLLNVTINQTNGEIMTVSPAAAGYSVIATQTAPGSGVWTVTVSGFNAGDSIVYTTVGDHDAVLTEGTSGKWDLGGVNLEESVDLPDQVFNFTVEINDYDGDSSGGIFANFQVGVDGTGAADDGMVEDVEPLPAPVPLAPLGYEAAEAVPSFSSLVEVSRDWSDLHLAMVHNQNTNLL